MYYVIQNIYSLSLKSVAEKVLTSSGWNPHSSLSETVSFSNNEGR